MPFSTPRGQTMLGGYVNDIARNQEIVNFALSLPIVFENDALILKTLIKLIGSTIYIGDDIPIV